MAHPVLRPDAGATAGAGGWGPLGPSKIAHAPEAGQEVLAAPAVSADPVLRRCWTDEEKPQLLWDGLNSGQPLSQFAKRRQVHPSVPIQKFASGLAGKRMRATVARRGWWRRSCTGIRPI